MRADNPTEEFAPVRRGLTIRAGIIVAFGLIALFCVAMADTTADPDLSGVWVFLSLWPGAAAITTAFGSWMLTGRPW
jgi:hypothetical protein